MASHVKDVENFFKQHPNRPFLISDLCRRLRLTPDQVRNTLTYLRTKAKNGEAIDIQIIRRGKEWRYVPESVSTTMPNETSGVRAEWDLDGAYNETTTEGEPTVTARTKFWWLGFSDVNGHLLLKADNGKAYVAREL